MDEQPAKPVQILTVCGSLRGKSSNARLLDLIGRLPTRGVEFERFEGIGELPHFNPDIDREEDPVHEAVAAWRTALRRSDGVVISCPEYAHGVPGSFKNALDWLVSSADLLDKPVLLLNASPVGGEFAQPSLVETLTMLGAIVLAESRLEPFLSAAVWKDGPDAATENILRAGVEALAAAAGG